MFPTGIDLEQPSGQCHTEDMNVTMVGNRDERHDAGQVSRNSCNVDVVIEENTGPNVSGVMLDGRQEVHARDGINLNSVNNLEPHDGMEFESKEEAFSFYKEYARSVGFATVTKASRRSRISGNFIDAKFVCTRYGKKRESRSLETVGPVLNTDDTTVPLRKKRNRVNQSCSTQSISVPTSPPSRGPHDIEEVNQGNSTSKANKKKGTSQKRQVNQEPEAISIGLQDNWHRMGPRSIQASALDCSYESQANMHGPEQLNSRTPSSDGLFGTQQLVQVMGQLNSITPGRGDFYSNQQGMLGLGQSNSFAPIHGANHMTQQRIHGMGQLHFRPQTIPGVFDIHDDLENMDQSNVGASQLHGEASKQVHSKNVSR
ncbi:hypothetical protein SLA2020_230340 [Shorea laevis]